MKQHYVNFNGIPMSVFIRDHGPGPNQNGNIFHRQDYIDVKFEIIKEEEPKKPEPVLKSEELDKIGIKKETENETK
jgi:hypothetical protein